MSCIGLGRIDTRDLSDCILCVITVHVDVTLNRFKRIGRAGIPSCDGSIFLCGENSACDMGPNLFRVLAHPV